MPLTGIKVIELAGLVPGPHAGMILAEFGATVLRVDKVGSSTHLGQYLSNGKRSIALNLKDPEGVTIFREICKTSDVLIDPFRAGAIEKLGLGPDVLMKDNPRLVYARLTGYGQSGPYSDKAGHGINFLGLSGLLSLFIKTGSKSVVPVADFGGGSLTCAFGIVLALFERDTSGKGQVIDSNMVEGATYVGSFLYRAQEQFVGQVEGSDVELDADHHYYDAYETKDGKYMSVGAYEAHFYANLVRGLGLTKEKFPQLDITDEFKKVFEAKFLEKTQQEWCHIFDHLDACVMPVLTLEDAGENSHHIARQFFLKDGQRFVPKPHPILSRTPGKSNIVKARPEIGELTHTILKSLQYNEDSISKLISKGTVQ